MMLKDKEIQKSIEEEGLQFENYYELKHQRDKKLYKPYEKKSQSVSSIIDT